MTAGLPRYPASPRLTRAAKSTLGDLAQQHRLVLPIGDDGVAQVFEAPGHADIADEVFAALLVDEAAGGVGAEARDGGFDLVVGDVQALHQSEVRARPGIGALRRRSE